MLPFLQNLEALVGWKVLLFAALLLPVALLNRFVATGEHRRYVFSYIMGSAIAAILIAFVQTMSMPWFKGNPFLVALGIFAIMGLWKFLFGPWGAEIKAAVLGTFVFWITVGKIEDASTTERIAMVLAALIAFIPSVIWCLLFLREHRTRVSAVVLTFLAGMLSTAPILFYDHVVRNGFELHLFLFRITPEHFMRSSETFVAHSLTGQLGIVSTSAVVTIVSFILVGVIEEWSKNWVIRKSDRSVFTSIDDVIQLSIIAAIGFAFAENVVNPNYFIAFVRDYLVMPSHSQWGAFLASVFGRSVITNMVHITSSGVLGYYYGLAFFAQPVLEEDRARGRRHRLIGFLHKIFQVRRVTLFQDEMMLEGLLAAIGLHSLFNIIVSLPEILPGKPDTLGELFHYSGAMSSVTIIALPSFLYVFGGWFLLLHLFKKKEDVKEYGRKINTEVFVREVAAA